MNFEQIYQRANEASHETAFRGDEARALYDYLYKIPTGSNVIEIGIEFGRTTTIIAEVAKQRNLHHFAIDNFSQDNGEQYKSFQFGRAKNYDWSQTIFIESDSKDAPIDRRKRYSLIFIDGDHSYEGVKSDIEIYRPLLAKNGYMMFHDYGRGSLEGVTDAVDESGLNHIETIYTLGVFNEA